MKVRSEYTCPLELTHYIIRGKWKPIILWQLGYHPTSLAELQRAIAGIGQKMLLQNLNELQEFDMVQKRQFEGYPLKVEYSLTERGRRMRDAVVTMQEDGKDDLLKKKGLI